MPDVLTPEQRSFNMSRIRGRDTSPEMLLRRGLHAAGFRFRLHVRELAGRPDMVLPRYRVVVLVHGCFWHGHNCPLFKWPATRPEFWKDKIAANQKRDRRAKERLLQDGWRILTVWECSLKGPLRIGETTVLRQSAAFIKGSKAQTEIVGRRRKETANRRG